MKLLGQRIKTRRETKKLNLKEFGELISSSASFVSQVENNKATPSIATLKKMAEVLDTTVSELIGEFDHIKFYPIIKFSEKKFIKKSSCGAMMYLLSNHSETQKMEPFYIETPPKTRADDLLDNNYDQAYIFVLDGVLSITSKKREYKVEINDSFYINRNDILKIENIDDNVVAKFLIVLNHYK